MKRGIQLGKEYRDELTGFTGTATARSEYLYGCVRINLESGKDGDAKEAVFDEQRLIEVKAERKPTSKATSGGNNPTGARLWIEVYDRGETRFKTPSWWRMLWLRFATREAAEQYLVLRGAP